MRAAMPREDTPAENRARLPAWAPPDAGRAFAAREVPGVSARGGAEGAAVSRVRNPPPEELAERLLRGERGALARAITLVESNAPRHRPLARIVLEKAAAAGRHARRVGISGVPGVGKSTFIEAFGNFLCDRGSRVAVLAVDPTSSLSGGSI
ncbi:MAG: ATP/GTP-binding protein, partial [Terrimicrobiaceae bacterium]|nr:ATP/GTP-binding protein [Terrimicrobiaceae bacterium]